MDARVDEITGVRFASELHPFPSYSGPELLAVQFLGRVGTVRCQRESLPSPMMVVRDPTEY
jgi:hypothetical protein